MANFKIVTAYAYSAKFKSYTVGAYVLESNLAGLPAGDTFKVLATYTIDDDKDAALSEAIERIYKDNARHPVSMPIEARGRVSLERVQGFAF